MYPLKYTKKQFSYVLYLIKGCVRMRKEVDIQEIANEIIKAAVNEIEGVYPGDAPAVPIFNKQEEKSLKDEVSGYLKKTLSEIDYGFELVNDGEYHGAKYIEDGEGEDRTTFLALHDVAADILEPIEDTLESKNIIVPDEERPDDEATPLYGTVYDNIQESIEDILSKYLEGCENGISFKSPEKAKENRSSGKCQEL